jgi:hypothetical protein
LKSVPQLPPTDEAEDVLCGGVLSEDNERRDVLSTGRNVVVDTMRLDHLASPAITASGRQGGALIEKTGFVGQIRQL